MNYYVCADFEGYEMGTRENPFRRISSAAEAATAGDEVIVAPGIYREYVNPRNGGTAEKPICYRAEKKGTAVICGSEQVKNWTRYNGNTWMVKISNGIFGGYNPYTTLLYGDWHYSKMPVHTGEVYFNGKSMYEAESLEKVLSPTVYEPSWDHEGTLYQWYTEQENNNTLIYANFQGEDPNENLVEINVRRNCFYPDRTGINYITVTGFVIRQAATTWAPPTACQEGMIGPHWSKGWVIEDCEISDSKCVGISLGKYLQPQNENKWTKTRLKNGTQTQRDAVCQAQIDGWSKETIGSHIVRRCDIHDCEQAGIVGHLGCVFSLIEDNHIHDISTKQQIIGAETGGIKLHAPIDVVIRRNHIHHCVRGIWLDWQAQGTRVTQNLLHDNMPPLDSKILYGVSMGEDLFIEVSHGPTLVDNNILLSAFSVRLATQGTAFVHNLIAGPFTSVGTGTNNGPNTGPRYTPYHVPHRTEIAGFMTFLHGDNRFYNNIFIQREVPLPYREFAAANKLHHINYVTGTSPFDGYPTHQEYMSAFFDENDRGFTENRSKYYDKLPVYTGGNVYFNDAKPCDKEENYALVKDQEVFVRLKESDGKYCLETNLYDCMPAIDAPFISTEMLGEAFEPEQGFENPDGSPILFDTDYCGDRRGVAVMPGPIEHYHASLDVNVSAK
ncbi:MAG: right-handed parallel beta-helix repeat-containing protein [Acetatifactor sp.]|nr:right-handed parallel beta-helix repeat-containing protein [Acetatifactor sp.]